MINCKNATLGYYSKVVIENLSFNVNEGDYLLIIGENGCGKSTLMKTMLGLTPILNGEFELEDGLVKNQIGYLPQQTEIQKDFPATVSEIVRSGCLNKMKMRPFYNKEEKAKADANMEKIGILDLKNKSFSELSGGQKQRVLLARALCATEKVLLLDEPVSGLDPETTEQMYKLIAKLNQEITVIMITHDLQSSLVDATHVLKLGKDRFYGTKEEYVKYKEEQKNG